MSPLIAMLQEAAEMHSATIVAPGVASASGDSSLVPAAEYRYVDEAGNEYRYCLDERGDATIVDCVAAGGAVEVPSRIGGHEVVAIGEGAFASSARKGVGIALPLAQSTVGAGKPIGPATLSARFSFSRNTSLVRVALPYGLRSIGEGAFRGCLALERVELPDTLEEIGGYAFSCTGLKELDLPKACVRLAPMALRLGPQSLAQANAPFSSRLERVGVAFDNPRYCLVGNLLCRRLGDGSLEAVLCPGRVGEVNLAGAVTRISEGAFAGTTFIDTLVVREGVLLAGENGLIADGICNRVRIVRNGAADVEVDMPKGLPGRRVLGSLSGSRTLEAPAFLYAYDEALFAIDDRLEQAQLMLARLSQPTLLDAYVRERFLEVLSPELDALCVHFGARGYWKGFDSLVDAGVLDRDGIARAVDLLSARSDSAAVSHLLRLKQQRFAVSAWDYDL